MEAEKAPFPSVFRLAHRVEAAGSKAQLQLVAIPIAIVAGPAHGVESHPLVALLLPQLQEPAEKVRLVSDLRTDGKLLELATSTHTKHIAARCHPVGGRSNKLKQRALAAPTRTQQHPCPRRTRTHRPATTLGVEPAAVLGLQPVQQDLDWLLSTATSCHVSRSSDCAGTQ